MDNILDGKATASYFDEEMLTRIAKLKEKDITPGLAVIMVGDNSASEIYVRNKKRRAEKLGFNFEEILLLDSISESELLSEIDKLNNRDDIDGFIVQLPLPKHINEDTIVNAVNPAKDVDGFAPYNVGKLYMNDPQQVPATAKGIMLLLEKYKIDVDGKNVVIVGRSNIVGRPVASLMLNAHATVTITHSHTKNLSEVTRQADILIVAIGRSEFITADFVKDGAVVVDVGMNRVDGKLTGDVKFDEVSPKASLITPVPGGVGPMTITGLMYQTIQIAERRANAKG
ncbi:tetrahydrofolate dehydrogenase/cyclohydrolase catalytic domain-containing protein [Lactobacillus sp. YT155]|uniref:bifunctional 5,10-methylenetetrahydrofolate dehydrogenase/5,10-methenyltetrahydrofolate cyclohydrolase n=1 Tax=Lactobacillus sp. YT155 TaxID=3060955 RepID=UPI00265E4079|nr:tetrahydrofolate dehydrogenase/cyclohydrolase catalytic domain-containing protein [Lactobacillus sp. YT155]MDO1605558.1 tetrahydrofolate dehydrogenase/cyclohydrolase catalytic domain-containing protein [Lactobacillus sp. YT155]